MRFGHSHFVEFLVSERSEAARGAKRHVSLTNIMQALCAYPSEICMYQLWGLGIDLL